MNTITRKASRPKQLLIIAALALSVLALAALARSVVQRPEILLESQAPAAARPAAGPLNALTPDRLTEPLAPVR